MFFSLKFASLSQILHFYTFCLNEWILCSKDHNLKSIRVMDERNEKAALNNLLKVFKNGTSNLAIQQKRVIGMKPSINL